jgi:hydrogenase maturation factor HypF (carbamoyltransferase family)
MDVQGQRPCPSCQKIYSVQDIRAHRRSGPFSCPNCRAYLAIRTNDDESDWQWVGLKAAKKELKVGHKRNLYAKIPMR